MNPSFSAPSRGLISAIFTLAWPTIIEQLLQTVVQYADSAMVGQLGAAASAAVGITTSPMWLVSSFFLAAGIGVLAVTARALAARGARPGWTDGSTVDLFDPFSRPRGGRIGLVSKRLAARLDGR